MRVFGTLRKIEYQYKTGKMATLEYADLYHRHRHYIFSNYTRDFYR